MAKLNINIGTSPNARDGDPIRVAFTKVNENFSELYTLVGGDVAALTEIAQDYAAEMLVNGEHSGIVVDYNDEENTLNLSVNIVDGGGPGTTF